MKQIAVCVLMLFGGNVSAALGSGEGGGPPEVDLFCYEDFDEIFAEVFGESLNAHNRAEFPPHFYSRNRYAPLPIEDDSSSDGEMFRIFPLDDPLIDWRDELDWGDEEEDYPVYGGVAVPLFGRRHVRELHVDPEAPAIPSLEEPTVSNRSIEPRPVRHVLERLDAQSVSTITAGILLKIAIINYWHSK